MLRKSLAILPALAAGVVLSSLLPMAHAADADAAKAVMRQHQCFTCHAVAATKIGPSFEAIATKFAGQSGEMQTLEKAIQHGEKGTFGATPMPANPTVSDDDAKLIAGWISSLKK